MSFYYDISFIQELTHNDENMIKSVVQTFLNSVPPLIESLMSSCEKQDWLQTAKDAHSLKSNIDALQIKSIHDDVKNIDIFGKQNIQLELIPGMCKKVKEVLELCIDELKLDYSM